MDFKQLAIDVKDMDAAKGIVVAYANAYNNKDSDGDISADGSFDFSVANHFPRIRVLKDHNPRESLGVPLEINSKDSYGLLTTTQFNMGKQLSRDMFSDVKLMHENGMNAELSVGYEVIARDKSNKAIITQYKLFEYSFLSSWAANELSTVRSIKGDESEKRIVDIIRKAYDLPYSDVRLIKIEKILESIEKGEQVNVHSIINEFNNSIK